MTRSRADPKSGKTPEGAGSQIGASGVVWAGRHGLGGAEGRVEARPGVQPVQVDLSDPLLHVHESLTRPSRWKWRKERQLGSDE